MLLRSADPAVVCEGPTPFDFSLEKSVGQFCAAKFLRGRNNKKEEKRLPTPFL